jgi:patatin-like phospholipase/acyl hydrolase
MAKYRILSLDGGGSWALIEVMALIEMYTATTTGHQVLNDFDLAVANSGGSIVLGGLVEDMQLGMLRNKSCSGSKPHSPCAAK